MIATPTQARNEMLAAFRAVWLADPISASLPVLYPDTRHEPPAEGAWARISVQHGDGRQATLSNEEGKRRWRHTGILTVQIFTPRGYGLALNDKLSAIAKRAFEGVTTTPGRVVFYRVRMREIGQDGQWFNTNVLADFEYDEVR